MKTLRQFVSVFVFFCVAASANALEKMDRCQELLRPHRALIKELLAPKIKLYERIVVLEEGGRLASSETYPDPRYSFEVAVGMREPISPTTREERDENPIPRFPPLHDSYLMVERLYPLVGDGPDRLDARLNFDTAPNAYTVFNQYTHALEDGYRQLVIACETLRLQIRAGAPRQLSLSQLEIVRTYFEALASGTLPLDEAVVHAIAQLPSGELDTYRTLETKMTEESVRAVLRGGDLDSYLKTYLLHERLRVELADLTADLRSSSD